MAHRGIYSAGQYDLFNGVAPPLATQPIQFHKVAVEQPQKWVYTGLNVHISPTRIFCKPEFSGGAIVRTLAQRAAEVNLANNRHQGDLSAKAQDKIRNAVNWLALASPKQTVYHRATDRNYTFKLNFITLTLPDTDESITQKDFTSKLLQPWLSYARQYFNLQNYVWKIEPQKNGKLHVHITSNVFIHHADLRRSWNYQLDRNGYLTAFAAKFGHKNAPTEQVKAVKSVRNIAGYCAKYLSKVDEGGALKEGRLWGCSYRLSAARRCATHAGAQDELSVVGTLIKNPIEERHHFGKMKANGFLQLIGTSYFVKGWHWLSLIQGEIKRAFSDTIHFIQTGYVDDGPILIPLEYQ